MVIGGLEGLVHAIRETLQLRRERKHRFQRALHFNRDNTFTDTRLALWMCPTCSRTHTPIDASPLTGPNYPGCCEHKYGHRKAREHATGLSRI